MAGENTTRHTKPVDPIINSTVGNYLVSRKIGEGGMGSVYLAEHPLIGKKVALKVLHAEFASNQDVVTRFFNEARAVNDIQHPNIVDIIDYGVIPSDRGDMVYFIMEHLDGFPLEDVIAEQSPLSPERSLHICAQVADALAASHNSNIVHRDLKPDNIILVKHRSTDDFAKLLDFGIAKLTGDQPGSSRTRTGIVMGTPSYMSPEQCEGKGNIDKRTDVYALGVVLYQMLTGQVPFLGSGYGEILVQHLTQTPAPPSTIRGVIPPHVEAVCMKALEKSPDARYQCMEDFGAALTNPVGFVEANGGLQGFYSTGLGSPVVPTSPPSDRATTAPPDFQTGIGTAASTQYPSGIYQPAKSKAPIFVGLGVVAAAGIAAAVVLGGGGDDKVAKNEPAAAPVAPEPPPKPEVKPKVTPPDPKPETVVVPVSLKLSSKPRADIYINEEPNGRTNSGQWIRFDSDDLPMTIVLRKKGYEDKEVMWGFKEEQKKQRYNMRVELTKESRSRRKVWEAREATATPKPAITTTSKPKVTKSKAGNTLIAPTIEPSSKPKKPKQTGNNLVEPEL
ncbi:MAG: serine/threonine protein kinase [Myxococcales bacterium]|nr:serine/threonine protein kinase [Myxococcales bacterium]